MDKLNLHSEGKNEHLKQIRRQFEINLDKLKMDKNLTELKKNEAIKKLESEYNKMKTDSDFGLF